jgi:hypothetical protein
MFNLRNVQRDIYCFLELGSRNAKFTSNLPHKGLVIDSIGSGKSLGAARAHCILYGGESEENSSTGKDVTHNNGNLDSATVILGGRKEKERPDILPEYFLERWNECTKNEQEFMVTNKAVPPLVSTE